MAEDADLIHVGSADVGQPVDTGVKGAPMGSPNVPEDVGRVKDVGAAHDMAELKAKVITAEQILQNRENELTKGITLEEENNLLGMDTLLQKYPAAFMADDKGNPRFRDKKGLPFIMTRPTKDVPTLVVTQNGAVEFTNNYNWEYSKQSFQPIDLDHIRQDDIPILGTFAAERAEDTRVNKYKHLMGLGGLKTQDGHEMTISTKDAYQVSQNPDQIRLIAQSGQSFFRGEVIAPVVKPDFISKL